MGVFRVGAISNEFQPMRKTSDLNGATMGMRWSTMRDILKKVFSTMIPASGIDFCSANCARWKAAAPPNDRPKRKILSESTRLYLEMN